MKNTVFITSCLFILSLNVQAQDPNYKTAIGFRLGPSSGLTVKHFIGDKAAIEGLLSRRWKGFNLTGLYEINNTIGSVPGLNWYYGGGAHVGFWHGYQGHPWFKEGDYTVFGVDGIIGLEYNFAGAPINVSLDFKPSFNLLGYKGIWGDEGAVSIRYLIR